MPEEEDNSLKTPPESGKKHESQVYPLVFPFNTQDLQVMKGKIRINADSLSLDSCSGGQRFLVFESSFESSSVGIKRDSS